MRRDRGKKYILLSGGKAWRNRPDADTGASSGVDPGVDPGVDSGASSDTNSRANTWEIIGAAASENAPVGVLFSAPDTPPETEQATRVFDSVSDAPETEAKKEGTKLFGLFNTGKRAKSEKLQKADNADKAETAENVEAAGEIQGKGEKATLVTKLRSMFTAKKAGSTAESDASKAKTKVFTAVKPEISEEHLYSDTAGGETIFTRRTKPRNLPLSIVFTVLKLLAVVLFAVGFAALGLVTGIARAYVDTSPELDIGLITNQAQTSVVYDRNGDVITTFAGLENREWASIDEIPDMLKNAFIAIEDVRFLKHSGVDFKRLASAVINTLMNKNTHGGSTITQQLIKNRVLSSEQSYKRKIQEAFLALELETEYTKDNILEAYLNAIPLGGLNYGVKAAAKDYFGKELSQLTIRECAMLAGITQNPTTYNPRSNYYNENRSFDTTNDRTDTVLAAMYDAGFITKAQYDSALTEEVYILKNSSVSSMYDMPAFVEYAVTDVISYMLKDRGLEDTASNRSAMESELRTGGYHIYTTVDPDIQNTVQETLSTWEEYPRIADPTHATTISKNSDGTIDEVVQPQAAAVVIEQATGEIVALVGGRDEPTRKKLLNRAVASNMPIGSSIKPIAIYAPALEQGASPSSVIMNFAQAIDGWNTEKGYPSGGLTNQGPTTVRTGIVKSLNVVAARTLFEKVGTDLSREYLINLGISGDDIFADGPGLALGTSGISMLELTAAYSALATGGEYSQPISFTKVTDAKGNVVLDATELRTTRRVFKTTTSWMITDMLQNAVRSGTGSKAKIPDMTVAGKTGTNDSYRGVVFAGYTPYYTSAVWIGHDDYKYALRSGSTGGDYAAPLWQAYMAKIHEGLEDKAILDYNAGDVGLVRATTCTVSGLVATDACKADEDGFSPVTDWFEAAGIPKATCDMHVSVDICKDSGKLATHYCPAESVERGARLVIPVESELGKIDLTLLQQYMPHAITGLKSADELLNALEGSAVYASYYCDVHTAPTTRKPTAEELTYAQTLIDFAESMIADPYYTLTSEQYQRLTVGANELRTAADTAVDGDEIVRLSHELYTICTEIQTGLQPDYDDGFVG